MGAKLVLDDADSSSYADFGSPLGSWEAGCARKGCGEDRGDLDCLASHPKRRTLGFITQTICKLQRMVAKHTHFSRRSQATFHSCLRDTHVAATAISCAPWVVEIDELRLNWS